MKALLVQVLFVAAAGAAAAQNYDPTKTFAPLTLPDPVNQYRSGNGAPGPDYWQNSADYEVHANLDTAAKQLSATEIVTYTNNSPDILPSLWVQLDQNTYRQDARSNTAGTRPRAESSDGIVFESAEIESQDHRSKAVYIVSDTRMQIRLAELSFLFSWIRPEESA